MAPHSFLIGWPVTVDEVWETLAVVFQQETIILIHSPNNFLMALKKQDRVERQHNKHLRYGRERRLSIPSSSSASQQQPAAQLLRGAA